jgi:hypothetical protein
MRPSAGLSYLYSGCDDDGDGEDPQLDGGEAGVSNVHHLPHAPRQELHQVLILYRYRHRVVCRIDALPYIRAFMRNSVFLSRPSAGLVPVSRNG